MALKQPASLFDLSSCALGSFIAENALLVMGKIHSETGNVNYIDNMNLESSIKKFSEHYDTAIPRVFHNLVTYDTMQCIKEKEDWIWENDFVFDIIFRSHVTKFDFSDWPWEMHSMFYRNLSKLKHLKLLNIDYVEDDDLKSVLEGIKFMEKLEKFCFKYCSCYNDIVKELCDNCPLLSLKLNHYSVNDTYVSYLLKLHNLEELQIYGTKISDLGTKQLLLAFPQLKTFSSPKNFSLGSECDILTSLQSFEVMFPSQQTVENLTLFCPSVINLKLITFDPLNLSNVANFDYLATLYISAPYFYLCNILNILQRRGHQITSLGLTRMRDISLEILLNIVNTSCPNLKNLYLQLIPLSMDVGFFPTEIQNAFQNLEFVNIDICEDMTSCFIYLLCVSVNIRQVYFKSMEKLCDDDINKIISCNPLVHLQELCIRKHNLTVKSIYNLLSSCKKLKYIGYVDWWETITKSELKELRNYIKKNKLNVEFVGSYEVINTYPHLGEKKRVSVMKPEYSELPQSALYLCKSILGV